MNRSHVLIGGAIATAILIGSAAIGRAGRSEHPVDAKRETLNRVLVVKEWDRTVSPGKGEPGVSEEVAVDEAWRAVGDTLPSRVVDTYVDWDGQSLWIVSFQGGDVCPAVLGPPGRTDGAECGGNTWNVRIDAKTGKWLDSYANGMPMTIEQAAAAPLPTLEEFLSA